jgi:hypothetical protein
MLTLLGSLLGFISSAFPDLLKLWQDKQDRAHELQILDRQMEQMRFVHIPAELDHPFWFKLITDSGAS